MASMESISVLLSSAAGLLLLSDGRGGRAESCGGSAAGAGACGVVWPCCQRSGRRAGGRRAADEPARGRLRRKSGQGSTRGRQTDDRVDERTGNGRAPAYTSPRWWPTRWVDRAGLRTRWPIGVGGLVIDDGSTDNTETIAVAAGDRDVHHRGDGAGACVINNRGLGGALQSGFARAPVNVVVVVDCDLSYNPDHIPRSCTRSRTVRRRSPSSSPYMPACRTVGLPASLEGAAARSKRFWPPCPVSARAHLHR